jgi:hypothetical protein
MDKNDFLLASVLDIQATIRAIDVKIGGFLTASLAPFAFLKDIISATSTLLQQSNCCLVSLVVVAFYTVWFLAVLILFRAFAAIDNPFGHIDQSNTTDKPNGIFFRGGLFKHNFVNSIWNCENKSQQTFDDCILNSDLNDDKIHKELVFEQMKLAYIRDMKMLRVNWAIKFLSIFYLLGFVLIILKKIV